jgi:hypothetical protein
MQTPGFLITKTLILGVTICFIGCRQNPDTPSVVNRPLPPPPAGELTYAGALPAHPFAKQAGNHFARTVFETDGPSNSHIEVRDVLIPPRSKSTVEALPGPAVIDPAGASNVTLSTGDNPEALAGGALRPLPAGQALAFENSDSHPATVRLYIIRSR